MKFWGIFSVFALFGVLLLVASYGLWLNNGVPQAEATVSSEARKAVVASKGPKKFQARKTSGGLEINGEIAADADRQVLARFAPIDQIDALTAVAESGTLDWLGGQLVVLEALGQAITGDVDMMRTDIALSVYVDTDAEKANVERLAKYLPPGFEMTTAILVRRPTIDPFTVSLEKIPGGDLMLSGYSETDDDRFVLMVEAAKAAGEAALSVDIQTGLGMPDDFLEIAKAAFPLITRVQQGSIEITGRRATLSGILGPGETRKKIRAALRPLPGEWALQLQE